MNYSPVLFLWRTTYDQCATSAFIVLRWFFCLDATGPEDFFATT